MNIQIIVWLFPSAYQTAIMLIYFNLKVTKTVALFRRTKCVPVKS